MGDITILLEDSAMPSSSPLLPPFELAQAPPLPSPWLRFIALNIGLEDYEGEDDCDDE